MAQTTQYHDIQVVGGKDDFVIGYNIHYVVLKKPRRVIGTSGGHSVASGGGAWRLAVYHRNNLILRLLN